MADYGHELVFGVFVPPVAQAADAVVDLAQRAERLGMDLFTVQDHPYQPAYLDALTLLSVVAARTERIRVAANVVNLPLRPPAVLARTIASLDVLSGGRVELGIGAGAFWDAIHAMGAPRRTPGQAVAALEEAITIIRALWTPGRTPRIDGAHYQLLGAKPGPLPVHRVEIWVGAYQPRMLELTARLGDGWLPSSAYAPPERLRAMTTRIDDAASSAGRSPGAIRRLYNIDGSFGRGAGFLDGTPAQWAEQLAELTLTEGISTFIVTSDPDRLPALHTFAEEVVPAVRAIVGRERGSRSAVDERRPASVGARSPSAQTAGVANLRAPSADVQIPGVRPTPDDGTRLSTRAPWDESARPVAAAAAADDYTAEGIRDAQQLIAVHDHLRQELSQIRDLVRQVAEGVVGVGAARSAINAMTMRANSWTLGAYCESYCQVVALHHSIEDQAVFPRLRAGSPGIENVLDRLTEEHHVIAAVLEEVDGALVALAVDPLRISGVDDAVDLLSDALLSHLSYEERQLVGPLARMPGGII